MTRDSKTNSNQKLTRKSSKSNQKSNSNQKSKSNQKLTRKSNSNQKLTGIGKSGPNQQFHCTRCKGNHLAVYCPVSRIRLRECFCGDGFKRACSDLALLEPKTEKQAARKKWLSEYLNAMDQVYGKPENEGLRWRDVTYRQRLNSTGVGFGRHQASNASFGPKYKDGHNSNVCLQGMLREMRPYGVGGKAMDLDFATCQPTSFSQLPNHLTWSDGRAPPKVGNITSFCEHRDELFTKLALYHSLDSDSERYDGYQKDILKKLTTQLFFGGSYAAWISQNNLRFIEPHPELKALEQEITALRPHIFESIQYAPVVAEWRKILHDEKEGNNKAIDRSIMARIAQDLESKCLLAMKAQLEDDGWTVLALIFDGAIVKLRQGCTIDLERLQNRVLKETGLNMTIKAKPLEGKLTLERDLS